MKKVLMLLCCLTVSLTLTGCGETKELVDAYKKMSVGEGENQINGYTMSIRLFGIYNEEKVSTSVRVNNYLNKDFKVAVDDVTYYLIDGEKHKAVESDGAGLSVSPLSTNSTVEETDEEIPFTNTDDFLATLNSAKADDEPLTDTIGEFEYQTYTYLASKKSMTKLLKDTVIKDAKVTKEVPAKVWIDSDGYVFKIEYDLSLAIENATNLTLSVYCGGVDNAREIYLDNFSFERDEIEE